MRQPLLQHFSLWRQALLGVACLASCAILGATAPAVADTQDAPPNCTGADYAGITAGVATAVSAYLFSHPDVNAYITELQGAPRGQSATRLVDYESAHPDVRADLAAMRQPIVDFDARCGYGTHDSLAAN